MKGEIKMEAHIGTDGVQGLKKYDVKVRGIVFMIYCLCAAGAFGIEEMIPEAGPGMSLILLAVFPFIWAYPISSLVAECGSVLPSEGGVYVWVREAFGEFWGFQTGWWATVSTYIGNAVYVTLVADYVSQMIPMSELAINILKFGMIGIFTVINLMGIKEVEKVSSVLSILLLLAFLLVTVVGLVNWNTNPIEPIMPEDYNVLDSLSGGICICIWMYCGYECISNMAGEVKNPQVIPKGLKIAMPLIALSYLLPTLGGLVSVGQWESWSTEGGFGNSVGYATVLTTYLGEVWGYFFLVIAIVSQCSIYNAYLASGSRGFFVLADDNLCPKFMVKVSKKRGVPYVGVLSIAIVTAIMSQGDFTSLVMTEVVFILALYIILPLAVIKLRKIIPVEDRLAKGCYVIKGGKLGLAYFTILPVVISIIALLVNGTDYFFVGIVGTGTGVIVYLIVKVIYGGMYKTDPVKHPLNKKTKLAFGDTIRVGLFFFIAGLFSLSGQIWLRWYEVDYGKWSPEDYDMFGNMIPQILDILKWGGVVLAVIGVILILIGKSIEKEENKLN